MDKIWYRDPSKSAVIGRVAGMKKPNAHAEPTKSRTLKKTKKLQCVWGYFRTALID